MTGFNCLVVPLSTREVTDKDRELIERLRESLGEKQVHDAVSRVSDISLPDSRIDLLVLLVLSGGVSRTAVQLQLQLKAPTLIVCHGEDNSLPSALGVLERRLVERPTLVLTYDRRQTEDTARTLLRIINACRAAFKALNAKIAVLFEDSIKVEWISFLKRTNIRIDFVREIVYDTSSYDNFIDSLVSSIEKIVTRREARGVTFDCFKLLREVRMTPCLAVAKLLDREIPVACECDLISLFGQVLLKEISPSLVRRSMIANIVNVDDEGKVVTVAHCTAPLSMGTRWELDKHFETGYPSGVRSYLPVGTRCVLFRVSSGFDSMFLSRGTVIRSVSELNDLRTCLTRAQIELDFKMEHLLGNHHVLVLDENVALSLKFAAWYLGLKIHGEPLPQVMKMPT